MRHALLLGEYQLCIDEKNRILVPADLRAEIREAFGSEPDAQKLVLTMDHERRLSLYPKKYFIELVSQIEQDINPDEDERKFYRMLFSMSSSVELDGQGRVLIPERALRRAGMGREVTLIGSGDHLEIWNRPDWERDFDANLPQLKEMGLRAKRARQSARQVKRPLDRVSAADVSTAE
ncbi:MAG: division/cell wall cluster transcriptional repressor MraZ [Tepidisphaeraceae bacterium]